MRRNNRSETPGALGSAFRDAAAGNGLLGSLFRAENRAPAIVFFVLVLLCAGNYAFPALRGKIGAVPLILLVSCAAFLVPALVFTLLTRGKYGFSPEKTAPRGGNYLKFLAASLLLLLFSGLLTKSAVCYITGSNAQGSAALFTGTGYFSALFCYTVLPAVLEEFVFRGVVFSVYEKSCGGLGAIVATAILFAEIHFSGSEFFSYFLSGIILGAVVYITRSLLPAILLHFVNNLAGYYLENALFKITSESRSGVLALFLLSAATLLALLWFLSVLIKICRRRMFSNQKAPGDPLAPRLLLPGTSLRHTVTTVFLSPVFWCCCALFAVYTLLQ